MNKSYASFLLQLCAVSFFMFSMMPISYANDNLWAALKQGGKVVLIRHAPVNQGTEAGNPLVRDPTCKSERNLSTQGQSNAKFVGSKFVENGILISEVFHSPFCRTAETARLAFGKAMPAGYLSLLEILETEEAEKQTEVLSHVIGSHVGKGNLILVTHEPNINAVSFELIKYLDILVLDPKGGSDYEELGVIKFHKP